MSNFANSEDLMKCNIILHFTRVYTVCRGKKDRQTKNTICLSFYNLTPLDMYNRLAQARCIKSKGKYISIQRGKVMIKKTFTVISELMISRTNRRLEESLYSGYA